MSFHVRKYSENTYHVIVELGIDPQTGKRRQKWYTVHGNKKEAMAFGARKDVELADNGMLADPGNTTVEQFIWRWFREYVEVALKISTRESYRQLITDHIVPHLGNVKLSKLRPEQIQRLYANLLQSGRKDGTGGLSRSTVIYVHRLLHSAFRLAVKWGLITRNLCDQVEPPKKVRKDVRVMSASEAEAFLNEARSNRLYICFLLALETGMREGEILGLRKQDVEFSEAILRVQKTICFKVNPPVLQNVKTDGSYRLVPIGPVTVQALKDFIALTEQEREFYADRYSNEWNDLVIKTKFGTPIEPTNLTRLYKKLLAKVGLPSDIRIHDMRHTSATLGLNSGVMLKTVSDRLGHSGVAITGDIYTHTFLPHQREATAKIDDQLGLSADDKGRS